MDSRADIAVIGAGAAGLFAAIWAGRTLRAQGSPARVLALDGARTLGAKILVAGGGRCNVTHHAVDETAYAGSSRHAIKNVLRRFDVPETVRFFDELGVQLKREETGKLFPVTDSARTVLNALLRAAREAGVEVVHPWRVAAVRASEGRFTIEPDREADDEAAPISAARVILATGGKSLPKSGSDGAGYAFAHSLGHSLTPSVFPALVPLVLDENKTVLRSLSGLTLDVGIELRSGTGKKLVSFADSMLCTHFGVSGPAVLDISRYLTAARQTDPGAHLVVSFLPGQAFEHVDAMLANNPRVSAGRRASELVPERLARALCAQCGIDPATPAGSLKREDRRALARGLTAYELPVVGDRGYTHAEVTAGGVPLAEIDIKTMASRVCPGLHLCGEICDVDGRIGGFNFQWAWASGYVAGVGAAQALVPSSS